MKVLIETALAAVWPQICDPKQLNTPDSSAGKTFTIANSDQDYVNVITEGGSSLHIRRAAFSEALHYLALHQHNQNLPCEIRSNQIAEEAGPLCLATRAVNSGTRVINYIVPMLANTGLVSFRSSRPNAVWLA